MPPAQWTLRVLPLVSVMLAVGACAASQGAQDPSPVTIGGVGVTPQQIGVPIPTAPATAPSTPIGENVDASNVEIPLPATPISTGTIAPAPTMPALTDNRVFMVGDSVMQAMAVGSPDSIDLYVGALGWDITVDAVEGRFTNEGRMVLRERSDEIHQIAVVMLGNNYGGGRDDFAAEVARILTQLDGAKAILWFNTPLFRAEQAEVNEVLHGAALLDRRLIVLDWRAASEVWPDSLRRDGVHPTQFGTDILAQMIGATLGPAPGAGPDVKIPRIGTSVRPDGTAADKGEARSTPRPGVTTTTSTAPPRLVATTTTLPRVRPTVIGATTTTRPGTTLAGSTTTTTKPGPTTSSATTTNPPGSTSTTTTSTTTTTTTAPPPTTTPPPPTTTPPPPTDPPPPPPTEPPPPPDPAP